ncbi:MAG: cobalamin biosynthesis protein CbiX [Burkholderiales bacterium]|jgi:sirohydrochlorin cobaltochelatase|nr:MAG: cobalamin biosynthesis protein CbiX [Burkholderiales bacterium]
MNRSGILLFAHGARDPAWARPFETVADRLRERASASGDEVTLAYLEFMSPTIAGAAADLVRKGCTRITVVPLFLGAGGHVRKDLPQLLEDMGRQHPDVQWILSPAVGETDVLIQGLVDAAWQLSQPED